MQKISKTKRLILSILRQYFEYRADIEVVLNDTVLIDPPYLILPNHTNNFDPFLVNIYVNRPIEYVTSDEYFRRFASRYFLKYTGAIPKTKFVRDTSVIKAIITRVRNNKIIGIFPEGRRSWDGTSENIIYSTTKLIKLLKIPVIVVTLKGAYLSYPRWARTNRWGKIDISYKLALTPEDIDKMSLPDIYGRLQEAFSYDEYNYQEKKRHLYRGKRLAENLEILLFTCPRCLSTGKMVSEGSHLYCTACRYTVLYNEYGYLENKDRLYFENPRDWNQWQLTRLKDLIINNDLQLSDENIDLFKLQHHKFQRAAVGRLLTENNSLLFRETSGNYSRLLDLDKISGLNIQYNNILEFYYDKELFRFKFTDIRASAYKWLNTLQYMKTTGQKSNR